ncbi:phytoene desaturase family protein [Mycolicibacterium parafortuitum]|uniref:Pyridine nucleotide-disulfide oxidoreductase domain-containing protein 2 n=1 Tax=Mycolicibacterium parafortuitum TaxID=39692 RepID=A0A375YET4_MYCPF|nr:NAD(P)/FAD-dependent oxidoreductase [Mycolicibacterium parafortuitum]ORB30106.1 dehydrogenase [Mycolicibacterium parafortuitum]SRX79589.1 putative dehydrogenase [Burkholderia xenovorans LB400] [Mycolicibacterium parafortuitum]
MPEEVRPSTTRTPREADVIVVGSGHNGLVAAAYLAKAGLDVLVVEAAPTAGGMTSTNSFAPEAPEYMINEASIQASLFRTTTINDDLELSTKYGLRQTVIDPAHFQLAADGSSLGLWRDPRKTAAELEYFSKKDARALIELYEVIDAAVEMGLPMMQTNVMQPDITSILKSAKGLMKNRKQLVALGRWMSSSQTEAVEESFEHDMIRAPLLTSLPFMPFDADMSGWSLIYLGVLSKYGVAMFHGGTGSLPKALIGVIKDNGGDIITNSPVEELLVTNGRCTGVRIRGGQEIRARRGVLTACSPKTTLTRLLPRGVLEPKKQNAADHIPTRKRGIADAKVNVALSGRVDMSKHEKWRGDGIDLRLACNCYHTYEQAKEAAKACVRGKVPDAIPGLAQVTNAFDPSMSPPGKDLWWFWTGLTPSFPEDGWDVARKQITDSIIKDADEFYKGVEDLQVAVRPLVLPDIEERFWAIDGSVYHVDPTITRFGPNKPVAGFAGYRTPVEGLFLTGSGTHPVAGISGMPGQNAARTMLKQFHLEDKGGRLGAVKDRLLRERKRAALTDDPYSSGPNDPFPGQQ